MTRALTIEVQMAPPHALSPNRAAGHPNPNALRTLRDAWADAWYWAAYESVAVFRDMDILPVFDGPVLVMLTYLKGRNAKSWDTDNLLSVCKGGQDQLAKAGIIADDRQITDYLVSQKRSPDGVGRLIVRVVACDGDERNER